MRTHWARQNFSGRIKDELSARCKESAVEGDL